MDGQNSLDRKPQGFSPFKFFVIFFIFLILLNLIYIDFLTFKLPNPDIIPATLPIKKAIQRESDVCPQSCVSQIQEATASYKFSTPSSTVASEEITSASKGVKEFFIPFGSGSNSSSDWQDVEALQAYVDSANYEDLKSVVFEASVHVSTGNQTASVRLFNATDKHPVWFSEVLFNGGGSPQFLISKPITLDEGNKLYKVQMKTELKFIAVLDQARIHIITK
jgi:hypothetical protein